MSRFLKLLLAVCFVILLLILSLVAPINHKSLSDYDFYHDMMQQLDTLQFEKHQASDFLKVGWSKVNITPTKPMPLAGYGMRGNFKSVHDSLYVRILTIDNGVFKAHLINADLLLFPPDLKDLLEQQFLQHNRACEYLYFGATHTHNGYGSWDETHMGQILMGNFDEAWLSELSDKILKGIDDASKMVLPARMNFWEALGSDFVWNRLSNSNFAVDDYMRGLEFVREDSSKAMFVTFSAHPTSIHSNNMEISADYPGVLLANLEHNKQYDFAMFMAGAVGSHAKNGFCKSDFDLCEEVGDALTSRIENGIQRARSVDSIDIIAATIPVLHGPSQLRISKHLRVRHWFFNFMNGPLKADIRLLVLGDVILMGTSNDFSGEILVRNQLPAFANNRGKKIIVSSFNGEYTGYITHDAHYANAVKEEVRTLNWVGPYFGTYYTEILEKIIDKIE
jgi:neutral ceramidase